MWPRPTVDDVLAAWNGPGNAETREALRPPRGPVGPFEVVAAGQGVTASPEGPYEVHVGVVSRSHIASTAPDEFLTVRFWYANGFRGEPATVILSARAEDGTFDLARAHMRFGPNASKGGGRAVHYPDGSLSLADPADRWGVPMIVAPWSSRFHGPGMEEGPDAVAAELGITDGERVSFDLDAPVDASLTDGLPRLAAAVAEAGDGPSMSLLGECPLPPAVVAGLRRRYPELVLVWVDAHGDLNTPETTPSGFLGGMPFAILLGWCRDDLRIAAGLDQPLPEERAALVGARDLDPGEAAAIERSQLVVADTVEEAIARLPAHAPIYLHVDGDVLDPADAPGVNFPAPGGWSVDRLREEMRSAAASGRVVGMSLCCGNPRLDPDGRSASAYVRGLAPVLTR